MINYLNVLNAIKKFIDYDMIPQSSGNQKIILRVVSTALITNPDKLWEKVKENEIIKMFNIINESEVDLDNLESILAPGLGDNEFEFGFKFLGNNYKFFINLNDVRKIKSYSGGM